MTGRISGGGRHRIASSIPVHPSMSPRSDAKDPRAGAPPTDARGRRAVPQPCRSGPCRHPSASGLELGSLSPSTAKTGTKRPSLKIVDQSLMPMWARRQRLRGIRPGPFTTEHARRSDRTSHDDLKSALAHDSSSSAPAAWAELHEGARRSSNGNSGVGFPAGRSCPRTQGVWHRPGLARLNDRRTCWSSPTVREQSRGREAVAARGRSARVQEQGTAGAAAGCLPGGGSGLG
jgi:hypothetical protein